MLVKEIMTKNVITIDCNATILDACKTFSKNKVGCLVVMDKNLIVGILTERDIVEEVILAKGDPKNTKVMDIMSTNIKTIHALASVEKAVEIMKSNNIKKLPVILNNEIVGIVTVTDMSRALAYFANTIQKLSLFYERNKEYLEKIVISVPFIVPSIRILFVKFQKASYYLSNLLFNHYFTSRNFVHNFGQQSKDI